MERLGLSCTDARIGDSTAVRFTPELIECVRIRAQKAGLAARDMISGAGHDACYVACVAPTTMIFVPCAGWHLAR
jgi:beta-ureidopropionase / N-carbamoyl-L-amino-acid hydrolase